MLSLATRTRLGPYEILAFLGAGGMSEVYRARDTRLDREVALKVLPASAFADPRRLDRLLREARAISRLNHPHIRALYDVGQQDAVTFLVMELLEGKTLADALLKGPLPIDHAIAFGLQIAQALDAAHTGGVIHRDLKPSNIMLTKDGVKLLDFSLAKLHECERTRTRSTPRVESVRRKREPSSGRAPTCPPSSCRDVRRMPGPTSLLSVSCSTRWSPEAARFKPTTVRRSLPRSSPRRRRRSRRAVRRRRCSIARSADAWKRTPRRAGRAPATSHRRCGG